MDPLAAAMQFMLSAVIYMEMGRPQVLHPRRRRVHPPMIYFPLVSMEVERLMPQVRSAAGRRRVGVMLTEFSITHEVNHVRGNMVDYTARYPAALELRTHLGYGIWEHLELFRLEVVKVAFLTRAVDRYRKSSLAIPQAMEDEIMRDFIDEYIPEMTSYISLTGEDELERFLNTHETLQDVIENEIAGVEDRIDNIDRIDIIDAIQLCPMPDIQKFFRRQLIYWLVYNFYFPVVGRMTWPQLARWYIRNLRRRVRRRRGNMEPPAWSGLRDMRVWDRNAIAIWNRAELEVILDIERRFTSLGPSSTF